MLSFLAAFLAFLTPLPAGEDSHSAEPRYNLRDRLIEPPPAVPPKEPEIDLDNFPLMPDRESQLDLVEQRFPATGNLELRKAALRKTLQYFPHDANVAYRVTYRLAKVSHQEGKLQEAWLALKGLLDPRGAPPLGYAAVGAEAVAVLFDMNSKTEAMALANKLIADPNMPADRKAIFYYYSAEIPGPREWQASMAKVRAGLALNDEEVAPFLLALEIRLLEAHGRDDDARAVLRKAAGRPAPEAAHLLAQVAREIGQSFLPTQAEQADVLLDFLDELASGFAPDPDLTNALAQAHATVGLASTAPTIQEKLLAYLKDHPLRALDAEGAKLKKAAELASAAERFTKAEDYSQALRYDLEILSRFPPGAGYDARLLAAARAARALEIGQDRAEPILPVLLELAEDLPKTGDAYILCRMLRSEIWAGKKNYAEAGAVFEQLRRVPRLPHWALADAEFWLAFCREMSHDRPAALDLYRKLAREPNDPRSQDAIVRGAFLSLETGHPAEAIALVQPFTNGKWPLSAKADYSWHLQDLVQQIKAPERARKYWETSAKWWPAWQALAGTLGASESALDFIFAHGPEPLRRGLETRVAAKDEQIQLGNLSKLAHAARWSPAMAGIFAEVQVHLPEQYPRARASTLQLAADFAAQVMPLQEAAMQQKLHLERAIALTDLEQYPDAWAEVRAFDEKQATGLGEMTPIVMARVEGYLAKRSEMHQEEAIEKLLQALRSPNYRTDRVTTILLLADLYQQTGRTREEFDLLDRELKLYRLAAPENSLAMDELRNRLEGRKREPSVPPAASLSGGSLEGLTRWVMQHHPAWYDYAEPHNLEDSRLEKLDAVLQKPSPTFIEPEIVKLHLLVAASPKMSDEQRWNSFWQGLVKLTGMQPTYAEARAICEEIAGEARYPARMRRNALWREAILAYESGHQDDLREVSNNPLFQQSTAAIRADLAALVSTLGLVESSPEALIDHARKLLAQAIPEMALTVFQRDIDDLTHLGKLEQAEVLIHQFESAKLTPEAELRRSATQAVLLKMIEYGRNRFALAEELRRIVLAHEKPPEKPPAAYLALLHRDRIDWLSDEEKHQIALYEIAHRLRPFTIDRWRIYLEGLPVKDQRGEVGLAFIEAVLRLGADDSERAHAFRYFSFPLDFGEAPAMARLAKILAPWRDEAANPELAKAIRAWERSVARRQGKSVEGATAADEELAGNGRPDELVHFADANARGDLAALRATVDHTDPSLLLSPRWIAISYRAYEQLGMKPVLAQDCLRKEVYLAALTGWTTLQVQAALRAWNFAELLHEPGLIPEGMLAEFRARIQDRQSVLLMEAGDAWLHGDWPRLLTSTEQMNREFPTQYRYFWWRAEALSHLGRKAEALQPLQTFLTYGTNDSNYARAKQLERELEQAAPAKGGGKT